MRVLLILILLSSCGRMAPTFDEKVISEKSKYNLIVLFDKNDCKVCLQEIKAFNKLHKDIDEHYLSVIGILNSDNMEDLTAFKKENDIRFKLLPDKDIYSKYFIGSSPYQMLVDIKKNKFILYQSFKKKSPSSQDATYNIVNEIIRNQD